MGMKASAAYPRGFAEHLATQHTSFMVRALDYRMTYIINYCLGLLQNISTDIDIIDRVMTILFK